MSEVTFPTEQEFNTWWVGKTDDDKYPRSETCPLARFIREHGYPEASVSLNTWFSNNSDRLGGSLPGWAIRLRIYFDQQETKRWVAKK